MSRHHFHLKTICILQMGYLSPSKVSRVLLLGLAICRIGIIIKGIKLMLIR